jgi:hypothetical protein
MSQPLPFTPPPSKVPQPFKVRPNDGEPGVATVYVKRLSELFVDPQYSAQPPAWQQVVIDAYTRYQQALQPPPMVGAPPQQPGAVQQPPKPAGPKIAAPSPALVA